jgi:hypothetical protein
MNTLLYVAWRTERTFCEAAMYGSRCLQHALRFGVRLILRFGFWLNFGFGVRLGSSFDWIEYPVCGVCECRDWLEVILKSPTFWRIPPAHG